METLNRFKFEEKKRKIKSWFSDKFNKALRFCKENREVAAALITGMASILVMVMKTLSRRKNQKEDTRLHDQMIYDRSEGHYWELKRKPRPYEWAEISRRKEMGESYRSILSSMKLLKNW